MIRKLENEFLTIEINETGAELFSIRSKNTNVEYLWQGNPEFWKGRSTVLFPICGRLFGGKYTYNGIEYEMPIHGIAKLFDFTANLISESEMEFVLVSSEESKKYYPFDFIFTVRYVLNAKTLKISFEVKNTGDDDMFFSYGGHPGFNVPFVDGTKFEDYFIEFTDTELSKYVFSDTCFCTGVTQKYSLPKKKLQLSHSLFDNDALFFETETDKVKLKCKNSKTAIEVSYRDMTSLGIWHKPKTEAPFVCIEPWHGIPSDDGVVDNLEDKNQVIKLKANKKYSNFYTIKIIEG